MRLLDLLPGTQVLHPEFGLGDVKVLSEKFVEILFNDGRKTFNEQNVDVLKATGARVKVEGLEKPLNEVLRGIVNEVVRELDLGLDFNEVTPELGVRWHGGRVIMEPRDKSLAPKEIDLEVFFHKIVMIRDNLRVLEQKINAHPKLNDAERVELEFYITKSYGTLSTFNLLFKEKHQSFKA